MFGQVLLLVSGLISLYCKFIAFAIFLIYVGGIIILIRYCVILLPSIKFTWYSLIPFLVGLPLIGTGFVVVSASYAFGLLYRARALMLVAILLYLVLLSVVSLVDYSTGIIKIYVQPLLLWAYLTSNLCILGND